WVGPEGDGTGVATDQADGADLGTVYRYNWPCCGGNITDFFQVNGVGRTNGLLQDHQPGNTPDKQWPFLGGSTFAVNPVNGDQIIISASGTDKNGKSGRILSTANQGQLWVEIGNPDSLDNSYAPALAYGAPETSGPGVGFTNFFL